MKTLRKIILTAVGLFLYCLLLFSCQTDKRELVVGKIQQASDLVTSEFVIDKIVFGKKSRNLLWFRLNDAKFLAYSQAKVKTGINLNLLKEENILIEGSKISLTLPPIEVINFSYPPSGFVEDSLISDPEVFLNKINLEDQEEFFRLAELDIRSNLAYMGIVKTSQEQTRKLLQTLLSSLGFQEIYIAFETDELRLPIVTLNQDMTEPE